MNAVAISTPASLLERLRTRNQKTDWDRFVRLYTPLLYAYARKLGLDINGADELLSDVFDVLLVELPRFQYDAKGSFRGWLWRVFINKHRERLRRRDLVKGAIRPDLDRLQDSNTIDEWIEEEYSRELVRRALVIVKRDFPEPTWQAFSRFVINGQPAAQVAVELGISVDAVYQAKLRVIRHVRRELAGLV